MNDFQCTNCGHQMDGTMPFHDAPDLCPKCGCTDFEEILGDPVDDRKENEHDFDYLAG